MDPQDPRNLSANLRDYYVIMPNHIHLLLSLLNGDGRADPSPTVVDVIARIKYEITKEIARDHKTTEKIFQRSFHDHVIRDRADYDKIADYIDKNPLTWQYDCFYQGE